MKDLYQKRGAKNIICFVSERTGAMNYKSPSSPESHADPDLTGVTDTSSPDVCILGWDGPTTCLQNYARLVGSGFGLADIPDLRLEEMCRLLTLATGIQLVFITVFMVVELSGGAGGTSGVAGTSHVLLFLTYCLLFFYADWIRRSINAAVYDADWIRRSSPHKLSSSAPLALFAIHLVILGAGLSIATSNFGGEDSKTCPAAQFLGWTLGTLTPLSLLPAARSPRFYLTACRSDGCCRVEIEINGTVGTICDDKWTAANVLVTCRTLGCNTGGGTFVESFGGGDGKIWMDEVECTGSENSLSECLFGPFRTRSAPGSGTDANWGSHNCKHNEDVGVCCNNCPQGAISNIVDQTGKSGTGQASNGIADNAKTWSNPMEQALIQEKGQTSCAINSDNRQAKIVLEFVFFVLTGLPSVLAGYQVAARTLEHKNNKVSVRGPPHQREPVSIT